MADRVHPVVHAMQATGGEHALDLVRAESQREQLVTSDRAMLHRRERRERLLPSMRSRKAALSADFSRFDRHDAIFARKVSQRARGL